MVLRGKQLGQSPKGTSVLVALSVSFVLAASIATAGAQSPASETTDHILQLAPKSLSSGARTRLKFEYMFDVSATWPGSTMRWRYNHANAPAAYASNKAAAIQQISQASAKWTAACGVRFVYDGETTQPPNFMANGGPDEQNVVGWQVLGASNAAITYSWYETIGATRNLVDSDILLNPTYVTSAASMSRSATHEWGHALGLGHSNVSATLMSGPPDSAYSGMSELTPDDVHGCRCLYGPPAGASAGYICSLPEFMDFGSASVGAPSPAKQVTLTNSGNAAMTVSNLRFGGTEFAIVNNGCALGAVLMPYSSCSFGVQARPASTGARSDELTIETSEGPYRVPLRSNGTSAPVSSTLNYEGVWSTAPMGAESGWGINLAHQGNVIFATWFTYDLNGNPWWLTMTATRTGDTVYEGTLYTTRGTPLTAPNYDPSAVVYTAVGNGRISFNDVNSAVFSYTVNGVVQTKTMTKLAFGVMPVCTSGSTTNPAVATNYQDLWWATGEAGWGVNFVHQGTTIFVTWFTYDVDGSPLWFSATLPELSPGVYTGTLYRTRGPAFNAVPFNPQNVVYTNAGTLTLAFLDGNNVTFQYRVNVGGTSINRTKVLTRLVFGTQGTICK